MNAQQLAAEYQSRKAKAKQAVLDHVATHPGTIRENISRALSHHGSAYVTNELNALIQAGQVRTERDNGLTRCYSN